MDIKDENPGAARTATGAEGDLFSRLNTPRIPLIVDRSNSNGGGNATRIRARVGGPDGPERTFRGRCAWALDQLARAGAAGVTPIDTPGPRWSDYCFKLKRQGVLIETIHEGHGGPYSGHHARYRLACHVEILEREAA